jgi:2-oxo-4-hydroxy-4-carboxy-5-ureidoimidazoline decarboxylase
MSEVLARWNQLPSDEAEHEVLPCCGSKAWARRMAAGRPFADEASLLATSEDAWRSLGEADWMEAFRSHPRIGETRAEQPSHARSAAWSAEEQRKAAGGGDVVKIALADANREYEARFNRIFIVCANGKSAGEILEILRRRLQNDAETELREAVEQQRQIIRLRITRWLAE